MSLRSVICAAISLPSLALGNQPQMAMSGLQDAQIAFSEKWAVLGPFQTGTREAAWGADPLEYYGGFSSLQPSENATFKSSLAPNGQVSWSTVDATAVRQSDQGSQASLTFSFPDIDWTFLTHVYGWSALQWQGWARGEITVDGDQPIRASLFTDAVLEYAIDGERFFGGDFFSFRKSPHVLHLTPGTHVLELRLIREVRAMGGIGDPVLYISLELEMCRAEVELINKTTLVSDVVDDRLPSPYVAIDVRNNGDNWVEVYSIEHASTNSDANLDIELYDGTSKLLAPRQTRPIVLKIGSHKSSPLNLTKLSFNVLYRYRNHDATPGSLPFTLNLTHKAIHEPHKVTYLHPGGIVGYSILKAPSPDTECPKSHASLGAPVMMQLHGAGVEADSPEIYDVIRGFPDLCAWLLFPSGVTPWSADDWHTWGFTGVLTSIAAIPDWIKATGWKGTGVDTEKWYAGGHSNGGQGAWYTLLHYPDKVFAASPLSGYLSIREYVPFTFRRATEPKKSAIVDATASTWRAELLVKNAKGIPIQQQHGSADDNVPAFHSRLMSELLKESGWGSNYSEVAGAPHWWTGIATTEVLKEFYLQEVSKAHDRLQVPDVFDLVVANPTDTGSKFGLRVLYLVESGELGRVHVARNEKTKSWTFETENVFAVEMNKNIWKSDVTIDGTSLGIAEDTTASAITIWRSKDGTWSTSKPSEQLREPEHMYGTDAIMRSNGPFEIVYHGLQSFAVALQVSRSLHQYFFADASIIAGGHDSQFHNAGTTGNRITFAIGDDFPAYLSASGFPVKILSSTSDCASEEKPAIVVQAPHRPTKTYSPRSESEALGAIYLRPLDERLELVIWGSNVKMLAQAARLVPAITGPGAPDWIILDESATWRGVDGCALGFFDARWQISGMSSFTLA